MKTSVLHKVMLSLGVLAAPLALPAKTSEQAYVASYTPRTDVPVPVSVVAPKVSSRYAGQLVRLDFVVDAAGNVTNITVATPAATSLVEPLKEALAQWKFSPARTAAGEPVAMKASVPFRIVDEYQTGPVVAMN